jgi:hypothetical protein
MNDEQMQKVKIELMSILDEVISLISLEQNDFSWSSWSGVQAALDDIEIYREMIGKNDFRCIPALQIVFAPTGPLQELSISSGWGDRFLVIADRFDRAVAS